MIRAKIRENTMQIIFQMDTAGTYDYEKMTILEENSEVLKQNQAVSTLCAIRDHIEEIDQIIERNTDNWKTSRIAKTDLAILRLAVCEMKYEDNIPRSVSINEAVNLAKKYGDNRSYAFINSVLSRVNRELEA